MAGGDDSAAVCGRPAAVCDQRIATIQAMKKKYLKAKTRVRFKKKKNVDASRTSFELPGAVQQSRLLSLPPELRNDIWKLCLSHPEDIGDEMKLQLEKRYSCFTMMIHQRSDEARPKLREAYESSASKRTKESIRSHSIRNLALMQTCQAVYNETAPVLWSQRFTFHSILHLQAFLFSDARLDLVRDIYVWVLNLQIGVNFMPAICALLADKVKNLDRFDVDMSSMHRKRAGFSGRYKAFRSDKEIQKAGVNLGFDVYSCMHPWVTKLTRERGIDRGIDRFMEILQIHRETGGLEDQQVGAHRIHSDFRRGGPLNANQQAIADTATAGEILRLVNLHEKKT